jgi:hypothetical protein
MKQFTNFCLLTLCIFVAGCSGNSSIQGLVPCQGTIKLDGKPLSGANISFVPMIETASGRIGVGISDGAGNFEIFSAVGSKGVFPGEYAVVVTKYIYATEDDRIVDKDRQTNGSNNVKFVMDGEQMKAVRTINGKEYPDDVNMQSSVPSKYTDTKTSDLRVVILADGSKAIKLELTNEQ